MDFLISPKTVLETSKLEKDFDLFESIFKKASVELLKNLSHESFAESLVYYD